MNFIYQHLPQRFYIHLPGVYEFYLRALVQRFYIHLNTLALWILFPRNLFISLGAKAMKSTNMKNRVCAGRIFSWPCARKYYPSRTFIQPQLWHFQSSGGLSHGKIFSDTGVETKEKCGVSRTRVCWRLKKNKQDFGNLNFIQICFAPEPLPMGNQCPKTHHKTSDPKIFISQIPVFNFSGPALHVTPHMWVNPSWTNVPTQTTKPQTPRFSSHTSLFWTLPEQLSILYPTCVPTLDQCPKTHHKTSDPKIFISHIPVLNFAGTDLHIIPHMCDNPSWTNVPRQTTKPQTPRFSSHTSLFWTLPEQISTLYPTCVATHPEPMSQDTPQNLRPQDFHLTHPCFELCRNRSPHYTPHVWQPILNQCPKTHHKTSDPKIFISHIPVLNFAGTDLHIIPHMCANPSWTNVPRHTTKPQTPRFHLTHPCFELCRNRSPYYTPHVCQPFLNQCPKTHHKTSDPKIFISHIPVLNFAGTDLHIIPHMCANPSWTNVPRHTTKPQTLRFSSHTSLFWTLPEKISILYPTCVPTHPEPMSQDTPQNLRPQDFHLTHPCFELCRNRSPYYTPHVCQPFLNQCPKTHHKTSDPKIFISHIPVLNFAGTDLHIIPHMCANPSWTNVPRQTTKPQTLRFSSHTYLFWTLPEQIATLYPTCVPTHPEPMSQDRPQNLRPQDFHLTHPCFELCRNRSPYYTPHVRQPFLNQCPKTDHKTSDPKIFISPIPVLNLARTDVGFELRGAPNWSRNSSWTWSLGWKMWKVNKGHAYLNASNLTQGILFFICLIRTTSMPRCFHWISIT